MTSPSWDRDNPLFFYGNEQKLDDLLGHVYGEIAIQVHLAQKSGGQVGVKAAA